MYWSTSRGRTASAPVGARPRHCGSVVGRALAPVESIRRGGRVDLDRTPTPARAGSSDRGRDRSSRRHDERDAAATSRRVRNGNAGSSRTRRMSCARRWRPSEQHAEVAIAHPGRQRARMYWRRVVLEEDLRMQRLVEDLLLLARMDERVRQGHGGRRPGRRGLRGDRAVVVPGRRRRSILARSRRGR